MPLGINRCRSALENWQPLPQLPSGTAPGYRNNASGALSYVGSYGYSCSCTPVTDGVTVRYLGFGTQYLYPSDAHNRAHGLQLRCLSE